MPLSRSPGNQRRLYLCGSLQGNSLVDLLRLMGERPHGQLGSIRGTDFPEDSIQILFDRSFRQMQFVGYFFVQFALGNQVDNLLFPKAQFGVERLGSDLGTPATGTDSSSSIPAEVGAASEAVSNEVDRSQFTCAHKVHSY